MQVLYFDAREFTPFSELIFWSFLNEKPDEADTSKKVNGISIEVISSVAPNDPINADFKNFACELVEESAVGSEQYRVPSVSSFNISNGFDNFRIEERLAKEM